MAAQQNLPRLPRDIKFRVLIIGRANAGKTSILKRVCGTTENPEVYQRNQNGRLEKVEAQFEPSIERGEHDIELEFIFPNHRGYVFHDSRGFECGDITELEIVQNFVRRKSQETRLNNRLHAIWYCVPTDNARPELDLRHIDKVCPDRNVPVIPVFTKYDQFRRDMELKLEDQPEGSDPTLLNDDVERTFREQYLSKLGESARFIKLEKMHRQEQMCTELIEETASQLDENVLAHMLLAVQKNNLELSIKEAIRR